MNIDSNHTQLDGKMSPNLEFFFFTKDSLCFGVPHLRFVNHSKYNSITQICTRCSAADPSRERTFHSLLSF
jgi:hypothetical protein